VTGRGLNRGRDSRAGIRARVDPQMAIHGAQPGPHALQAFMPGGDLVDQESVAIVLDAQPDSSLDALQLQRSLASVGMPVQIGQAFLGASIERQRSGAIKLGPRTDNDRHLTRKSRRKIACQSLNGHGKTKLLERSGMQSLDDPAQLGLPLLQKGFETLQSSAPIRPGWTALAAQPRDIKACRSEHTAEFVMQLLGQLAAQGISQCGFRSCSRHCAASDCRG